MKAENQLSPEVRLELIELGQFPAEHWTTLYDALVQATIDAPVSGSTMLAHLSHAELFYLLGFLIGNDAAHFGGQAVTDRINAARDAFGRPASTTGSTDVHL